ncbi:threonine-phosphate decarboxylase CobD [Nitrospirota bacterium]
MSHGGNVYKIAKSMGIAAGEVLDFSASINPLGMPKGIRPELNRSNGSLLHYPDPDATGFAQAAGEHYGIDIKNIMPGNGSTELIYLLPRALKPKRVLIPAPTFSEYERASLIAGARVTSFKMNADDAFMPEVKAFCGAMRGMDMAFLCNPGNPSGSVLERQDIISIIKAAKGERCVLVVDEAFMDFCPEHSVLDLNSPWLIVLRSLTKFYGLAGLRAGFLKAPGVIMKKLREHKEPWSVNILAERAAVIALSDTEFIKRTHAYINKERAVLAKGLGSFGFKVYPSDVNYLLIEKPEASTLARALLEQGIAVRECSNFKGLGTRFLRIAVRSRKENMRLMNVISELMEAS